jgi:hypothetical protein
MKKNKAGNLDGAHRRMKTSRKIGVNYILPPITTTKMPL